MQSKGSATPPNMRTVLEYNLIARFRNCATDLANGNWQVALEALMTIQNDIENGKDSLSPQALDRLRIRCFLKLALAYLQIDQKEVGRNYLEIAKGYFANAYEKESLMDLHSALEQASREFSAAAKASSGPSSVKPVVHVHWEDGCAEESPEVMANPMPLPPVDDEYKEVALETSVFPPVETEFRPGACQRILLSTTAEIEQSFDEAFVASLRSTIAPPPVQLSAEDHQAIAERRALAEARHRARLAPAPAPVLTPPKPVKLSPLNQLSITNHIKRISEGAKRTPLALKKIELMFKV
jgi:hypothetical protein